MTPNSDESYAKKTITVYVVLSRGPRKPSLFMRFGSRRPSKPLLFIVFGNPGQRKPVLFIMSGSPRPRKPVLFMWFWSLADAQAKKTITFYMEKLILG